MLQMYLTMVWFVKILLQDLSLYRTGVSLYVGAMKGTKTALNYASY